MIKWNINKPRLGDDFHLLEACMLTHAKSNARKVYDGLTKLILKQNGRYRVGEWRYTQSSSVEIIDIVRTTELSQTQVRYALTSLVKLGLVRLTKSRKPRQYSTQVELARAASATIENRCHALVPSAGGAAPSFEETRTTLISKINNRKKALRKAEREAKKAKCLEDLLTIETI